MAKKVKETKNNMDRAKNRTNTELKEEEVNVVVDESVEDSNVQAEMEHQKMKAESKGNNSTSEGIQVESDNDEISSLNQKIEELQNRILRTQADFDNYRKRTTAEKDEIAKYATAKLIEAILPALDNFQRAIDTVQDTSNLDSLLQGVKMVYRQIEESLTKEGLEEIESIGKPFNPEFHQAVMQVESDDYESGTVVEELQKGYKFKGKVIRPSMVKVNA